MQAVHNALDLCEAELVAMRASFKSSLEAAQRSR